MENLIRLLDGERAEAIWWPSQIELEGKVSKHFIKIYLASPYIEGISWAEVENDVLFQDFSMGLQAGES